MKAERLVRWSMMTIQGFLTGIMLWLSFALSLPGDTFSTPSWRQFAALGTESEWQFRFSIVAMIGLAGMVSSNSVIRASSVFVVATAHILVAVCFYLSFTETGVTNTAMGTYAIIAAHGYLFLILQRLM